MAKYNPIFNSFVAGEWSDKLGGRTELKGFYSSCATLDNFWIYNQGPAVKRPGTHYVYPAQFNDKDARLVGFKYSTEEAYILEVGDKYLRFFTDGAFVPTSGFPLIPYEIVSTYAEEDLPLLKFIQIADTMYVTHRKYPTQRLQRHGNDSWTLQNVDFIWPPFLDENETATTLSFSAATGTPVIATSSVGGTFTADNVGGHIKVTGSEILEGTLTNQDDFTTGVTIDSGEKIAFSLSGIWSGVVTLQRSYDGGTTYFDFLAFTSNTSQEVYAVEDGTMYRAYYTTDTSGEVDVRFTVQDRVGYCKIIEYTDATHVNVTVIEDLPITAGVPTIKWSESHFSPRRGYPGAAIFYEQRLLLGGTPYRPQTVFGSKVNSFENHDPGIGADSDAYIYELADEQVNNIQWMIGKKVVSIGTSASEWKFGSPYDPTTPTNPNVTNEKSYGASSVNAVKGLDLVMYIQRGGKTLRGLAVNEKATDVSFISVNLSAQADHIMKPGISEITWMLDPSPMLHMVRNDGKIATCAYDPEFEVRAFSTFTTDGEIESGAVIPGQGGGVDELWMLVAREIDGTTEKYIEYTGDPTFIDSESQFFVDSGIEYSGVATTIITGLDHLEGKEVNILSNGSVHPRRTVVSGEIELQAEATQAFVGLPYLATLRTQRAEGGVESGTSQGKKKMMPKAVIRLENTIGLKVGGDTGETKAHPFRDLAMKMDFPVEQFTGDISVSIPDRGTNAGRVVIEHDYPTACTIVAIMPTIKATGL